MSDLLSGWDIIDNDCCIEVIPINDIKEHKDEEDCICIPRTEYDNKLLIIHNSFDNREANEPKIRYNYERIQ